MYEPATGRAVARRVVEALSRGSRVVIGCSPGRPGRPAFLEELREIVPGIQADFVDAEGTVFPPGYVHLGLPGTSHEIGPRDHEGRTH